MADEKTQAFEETKWWIDRGPVKEREKPAAAPVKGIIEKWAYDLLKNYNQDQAAKNLVDINSKILSGLAVAPRRARRSGGRRVFGQSHHHRRADRCAFCRYKFYRCAIVRLLGQRATGGRTSFRQFG
jgi:hypothetical protein